MAPIDPAAPMMGGATFEVSPNGARGARGTGRARLGANAARWRRAFGPLAALGLGAWLALANLDGQLLWQDEAQSALLARTTLATGIPHGFDGANSLSQELGVEVDEHGRWRWHTWLHFYLVAASFALLGETTTAARLPAALLGLAVLPVAVALARALRRGRTAACCTGVALLALVPHWVLSRQCRYYSLATFAFAAALLGYVHAMRGRRAGAVALGAALVALFHAHYVYVPPLLAALALHAAYFHRAQWRRLAVPAAAALAVCLPWIVWQAGMEYPGSYVEAMRSPATWVANAAVFARRLLAHTSGLAWLAAGAGAVLLAFARGGPARAARALGGEGVALVVGPALATLAVLAVVAPGPFFRYAAPLLPLIAVGFGLACAALARTHRALAGAAVVAFLALQPLASFARELTHDIDGPIAGLVTFLRAHARPSDVVWITYGDMPLKLYTGLRVVGGLTGEDLDRALVDAPPDWVVIRSTVVHPDRDGRVRRFIEAHIDLGAFRKIELPFTDTAFENREEPGEHRFRSARGGPPVVVYERRR